MHRYLLYAVLISLCVATASEAQRTPQVTVFPIQMETGLPVEVRGYGFTPNRNVISHLRRPDQTEYGVLHFLTNERGEFSHTIDTMLMASGTHDLWIVDGTSEAVSNTVRFTVGFEATAPASPEILTARAPFIGVWRGAGERNGPAVPMTILISITGASTGSVAGTIAYPSLACGGVLTFRAVYIDSIEFYARSAYGAEQCPAQGNIALRLAAEGGILFEWSHPLLPETATGKLTPLTD